MYLPPFDAIDELIPITTLFVGIDLSKQSIAKAQQHSPFPVNRLAYVVGSAYALPFADGSIDAIVCSDVFEHLHDIPLAMREIHRVLRKGGMLVYDTVNRTTFSWYGTIVIAQNLLHYVPDHSHDWRMYIRPEEWVAMEEDRLRAEENWNRRRTVTCSFLEGAEMTS